MEGDMEERGRGEGGEREGRWMGDDGRYQSGIWKERIVGIPGIETKKESEIGEGD